MRFDFVGSCMGKKSRYKFESESSIESKSGLNLEEGTGSSSYYRKTWVEPSDVDKSSVKLTLIDGSEIEIVDREMHELLDTHRTSKQERLYSSGYVDSDE